MSVPGTSAAELAGQLAVVTGGAGGIGAAIVRALAAQGADVAIVDVAAPAINESDAASSARPRIRAWRCDVTRPADIAAACGEIEAVLGAPTILVNNVGGSGTVTIPDIEHVTDEVWEHILSLNLGAMLRFSRRFVPAMKARRAGRIVNITSSLKDGVFGGAATVGARLPYVTAKSGIVGFTKQLAKDLGPYGITVNAVAPGFTLPDPDARITKRYRALSAEQQRELTGNIPLGRPGDGQDIANAVRFLVSPSSGYLTGEVITVSGGA